MAADSIPSLRPERAAAGLRVSAYDRTTSLLIALLLLVGGAVFAIVIVYFSSRLERQPPAIPVTPFTPGDPGSAAEGDVNEMTPGVENAPEVLEPNLESMLEQLSIAATTDAVLMAEETVSDQASSAGPSRGDPRGTGTTGNGTGGSREPRREILFEPESFEQYADWFDRAGLEIAVLGTDNLVYYATKLSTPNPEVRTGDPDADQRLYFNSSGSPLYPLDRRLAEKAGILKHGSLVLQFCTPATQQKLLQLEQAAADGKPRTDIARTVFRVIKRGAAYDFEVSDQQYYR